MVKINLEKFKGILLENKEKDKLFLAPYNSGQHWVLFAINATSEIVYYLDPLHGYYNNYSDIKNIFDKYYILRFMKEIVDMNQTIIPKTYFDNSSPTYFERDLIEIKEDWC